MHLPPAFSGKLDAFIEHVGSWTRRGQKLVISTSHARRVREILADGDVRHVHLLDAINEVEDGAILILPQRLTAGFALGEVLVLTDSEIFGWQPTQSQLNTKRRGKKRDDKKKWSEKSSALTDLADLREGDFVVHINHGIARYGGVTRREVAGALNDYLQLEYDGEDRLYVPVGQLDRVQKYLGHDAVAPPLTSLKGGGWERAKKRVREEAERVAKELAALYAAREQAEKQPIGEDTPWQREMESAFPFEETPSQLSAIKDTKRDLEGDKPMDRLICGDVGFGKTEVAVRAAFKVAQDGRQVAVLVPTTVLAQQHYQTFSERLAPYPIRVEVLSRFRTPGEARKVIEDVRLGAVDILIGTHRLLQNTLEFRDLGLVVVDEEQRFGVMQKEKLKEMRREVDILTLSATPIPRTLQFALGGMREISLINDPPIGRLPVRTVVSPFKDELIRGAIERELERDGQVYYVHNRIESIYHIAEKIRQLVPARAHRHRSRTDERRRFGAGDVGFPASSHRSTFSDDDHRKRAGFTECKHDHCGSRRAFGLVADVSIARSRRSLEPPGVCVFLVWRQRTLERSQRKSFRGDSGNMPIWAPVLKSPCAIWKFAALAMYWASNKAAASARSALKCIPKCCAKPCRICVTSR